MLIQMLQSIAYALIGAIVGDSDSAERLAGVGTVLGAAEGAASGYEEQEAVLRNCLRELGYRVFNWGLHT